MIRENKTKGISVVIPTVGEESLINLIEDLKVGTVIPKEIIVVCPKKKINLFNNKICKNVIVLKSTKSGQVAQRFMGIQRASYNIILQLDADIILKKNTLEELLRAYHLKGPKVAISANVKVFDFNNQIINSIFKENKIKKVFKFLGGGNINILDDKDEFRFDSWFVTYEQPNKSKYVNVIPGGCTLFNKKYYRNFDYYPLKGHAIGEDILNSIYLKQYGNKLYFEKKAVIFQPKSSGYDHVTFKQLFYFLLKMYIIKKIACKLVNGNIYRYHLWFIYFFIISIIKYMLK